MSELATAFNRMLDEIADAQARAEADYQRLEEQKAALESTNTQLIQSRQTLQQQAMELDQASRYKSEFLSNMSHELRTPLNSMLILSRMLKENKDGNLDARQVEYATTIFHSGTELLDLINDILDLSKVEAGKLEIHSEPLLLQHLAEQLRRHFSHVAESRQLAFNVILDEELPAEISTDRKRVNQVLKNLLSNAFKFCSEGEVSVHFSRPAADARFTNPDLTTGSALAIAVADTGVGIPPEKKEEIFKAFQQADGKTSRQYGGTGLGLSISRKLAHLLGGEIQVESEEGCGSVFTLYLPITPVPDESGAPGVSEAPSGPLRAVKRAHTEEKDASNRAEPIFNGKSVLIFDENVRNIFETTSILEKQHIRVLIARDQTECLKQLQASPGADLALVDITPPGNNGLEAIRLIRNGEASGSMPILALMPRSDAANEQEYLEAGASECLTRPVEATRLLSRMRNYL